MDADKLKQAFSSELSQHIPSYVRVRSFDIKPNLDPEDFIRGDFLARVRFEPLTLIEVDPYRGIQLPDCYGDVYVPDGIKMSEEDVAREAVRRLFDYLNHKIDENLLKYQLKSLERSINVFVNKSFVDRPDGILVRVEYDRGIFVAVLNERIKIPLDIEEKCYAFTPHLNLTQRTFIKLEGVPI